MVYRKGIAWTRVTHKCVNTIVSEIAKCQILLPLSPAKVVPCKAQIS